MFKIIFASLVFCTSALADPLPPAIQYVGAVAINPSHDAKVVADWYLKLGVELHAAGGGYYGLFKTSAGPFFFAVHPKKADAAKESSASVSIVLRVNDYNAYVAMVEKNGLTAKSVEADSTGHFAHYVDPDGNEMTIWGD